MKITSTYKGYSINITPKYYKSQPEQIEYYECKIPTNYGLEDLELRSLSLDYLLYQHENTVDSYKNLVDNERIYHVLEVEYTKTGLDGSAQDSTLKAYYNYDTNQSFFNNITRKEYKKALTKEDLNFTPSTNTQELIDQFISFVNEKEDKFLKLNVPKLNINLEEKDRPSNSIKMQFLSTNGKVFTVPCHITEDGTIQCEPFTEENTIIGYSIRE
jgi:hypothetical protein